MKLAEVSGGIAGEVFFAYALKPVERVERGHIKFCGEGRRAACTECDDDFALLLPLDRMISVQPVVFDGESAARQVRAFLPVFQRLFTGNLNL